MEICELSWYCLYPATKRHIMSINNLLCKRAAFGCSVDSRDDSPQKRPRGPGPPVSAIDCRIDQPFQVPSPAELTCQFKVHWR